MEAEGDTGLNMQPWLGASHSVLSQELSVETDEKMKGPKVRIRAVVQTLRTSLP